MVKISSMASRRRRQSSERRSLTLNFVPPDRELGRKQPRAPLSRLQPLAACGRQALLPSQMPPQYHITSSPAHFSGSLPLQPVSVMLLNHSTSCIQSRVERTSVGRVKPCLLKNLIKSQAPATNERCTDNIQIAETSFRIPTCQQTRKIVVCFSALHCVSFLKALTSSTARGFARTNFLQ